MRVAFLIALFWPFLCSYCYTSEDERIVTLLPKVELHAHLHGSIRMATIKELAAARNLQLDTSAELSLEQCFKLFGMVHKVVNTLEVVKRITSEVLADYMAENTIYLELRTTPRTLADGSTPEMYVEMLVGLIEEHNVRFGDVMLVKLILSIDRASRFKDAVVISELAGDYRFISNTTEYPVKTIVGLDFSGNPTGGKFEDFSPLFDTARDRGLGITLHTAEVSALSDSADNSTEDDTQSILNFRPERMGHVLHLQQHHLDQMVVMLQQKDGPAPAIEICPTSNLITLGLSSYAEHPYLRTWLDLQYPISINTDDRGIFDSSLTLQLLYVKDAMKLDLADLVQILGSTIDQAFATTAEKTALKIRFWSTVQQLVGDNVDAELFKPPRKPNVKDMQDMSYLLYI